MSRELDRLNKEAWDRWVAELAEQGIDALEKQSRDLNAEWEEIEDQISALYQDGGKVTDVEVSYLEDERAAIDHKRDLLAEALAQLYRELPELSEENPSEGAHELLLYRGTQLTQRAGVHKNESFSYSLPVAIIWSARPGDWNRKAALTPSSTIHVVSVENAKVLVLGGNNISLGDVLRKLDYPNGISDDDVRKTYNYLHNRVVGRAKGGEFKYEVIDEDGDPVDEPMLSFSSPMTKISEARDVWEWERDEIGPLNVADRLSADTFVFADAPAIQRAAIARGYDAFLYDDLFAGGESAALEVLGVSLEDLDDVEEDVDVEGDIVPTHKTFRVLDPSVVREVETLPAAEALRRWRSSR